jgi:hypothetical protein
MVTRRMGYELELEAVECPVEPKPPRETEEDDDVDVVVRLVVERAEVKAAEVALPGTLAMPLPLSVRLTLLPLEVEYERHPLDDDDDEELELLACRGIRQPGCIAGVIPGGHGAAPMAFGGSSGWACRWLER